MCRACPSFVELVDGVELERFKDFLLAEYRFEGLACTTFQTAFASDIHRRSVINIDLDT